jgi:hypothetical protein
MTGKRKQTRVYIINQNDARAIMPALPVGFRNKLLSALLSAGVGERIFVAISTVGDERARLEIALRDRGVESVSYLMELDQ